MTKKRRTNDKDTKVRRKSKLMEIPIDRLHDLDVDLRSFRSPAHRDELRRDLRRSGLITPLLVAHVADDKLVVYDGRTRVEELKDLGVKSVMCVVTSMTVEQAEIEGMKVNVKRRRPDLMGVAKYYMYLREKRHLRNYQIADVFGVSQSYVSRVLRFNKLSVEDQKLLSEGQLTFDQAYARVMRKPPPESVTPKETRQCVACGETRPYYEFGYESPCQSCMILLHDALKRKRREEDEARKKSFATKDRTLDEHIENSE